MASIIVSSSEIWGWMWFLWGTSVSATSATTLLTGCRETVPSAARRAKAARFDFELQRLHGMDSRKNLPLDTDFSGTQDTSRASCICADLRVRGTSA